MENNINSLRSEFESFVAEKCSTEDCSVDGNEEIPDEELPYFTEELSKKLLAPSHCGVNLSKIDLKRVSDVLEDSIAIQERQRMLKALFRHKQTKAEMKMLFDNIELHINGRILIYKEIGENYPSSNQIFENYIMKAQNMKKTFARIINDFEDVNPDANPIHFDDI